MNRAKFVREALPVLTMLGIIEIFAGTALSKSDFHGISGLIAIIPALISIRGNVAGSFASRLGSMVHIGTFDIKHPFRTSRDGILAVIIMSVLLSTLVVTVAFIGFHLAHIRMNYVAVLTVVLLTSLTSSTLLSLLSVYSVSLAFKKEVDPDNVVTPLIATVGDFVTVFLLAAYIVLWEVLI